MLLSVIGTAAVGEKTVTFLRPVAMLLIQRFQQLQGRFPVKNSFFLRHCFHSGKFKKTAGCHSSSRIIIPQRFCRLAKIHRYQPVLRNIRRKIIPDFSAVSRYSAFPVCKKLKAKP